MEVVIVVASCPAEMYMYCIGITFQDNDNSSLIMFLHGPLETLIRHWTPLTVLLNLFSHVFTAELSFYLVDPCHMTLTRSIDNNDNNKNKLLNPLK